MLIMSWRYSGSQTSAEGQEGRHGSNRLEGITKMLRKSDTKRKRCYEKVIRNEKDVTKKCYETKNMLRKSVTKRKRCYEKVLRNEKDVTKKQKIFGSPNEAMGKTQLGKLIREWSKL
jgi:hypothetical protein